MRKVFQEFSREYEVLVYDDGSTDATAETLRPYAKVLPLTVLAGKDRRGYAAALDSLLREANTRTRYPRRDAVVVMQGDFTDQPEHLSELVRRFEGGADLVIAERAVETQRPARVRRLQRLAPWMLRPFVKVRGVADPFGSFRLARISVVRDLIKQRGTAPLVHGEGWAANVDLLLGLTPLARRVETLTLEPRYDLRLRRSRVRPIMDALKLSRFGWSARGRGTQPETT
jgi:glycosyltransferase involved in cell wall biosynthesis